MVEWNDKSGSIFVIQGKFMYMHKCDQMYNTERMYINNYN